MCAWFEFSFGSWFIDPTPIAQLVSRTLFDRATSEPACSFIRLYWHQISFVLLLYGQRIDTHLTDPPLGTDRGFPLVFDHRTNEVQFIRLLRRRSRWPPPLCLGEDWWRTSAPPVFKPEFLCSRALSFMGVYLYTRRPWVHNYTVRVYSCTFR